MENTLTPNTKKQWLAAAVCAAAVLIVCALPFADRDLVCLLYTSDAADE